MLMQLLACRARRRWAEVHGDHCKTRQRPTTMQRRKAVVAQSMTLRKGPATTPPETFRTASHAQSHALAQKLPRYLSSGGALYSPVMLRNSAKVCQSVLSKQDEQIWRL